MTEEEIKQNAIEYANKGCTECYMCSYSDHKNPYRDCRKYQERKKGFIAGVKCGLKQHAHDYLVKTKELKDENNKLLDVINNQDVKIADLEKKNIKLEEQNTKWKEDYIALENLKDNQIADLVKTRTDDYMAWSRQDELLNKKIEQLEQAKEIIAIGQRVCETSSAEYMSLYTKKAELFLREI